MFFYPFKHVCTTLGLLALCLVKIFPLSAQGLSETELYFRAITDQSPLSAPTRAPNLYVVQLPKQMRQHTLREFGAEILRPVGENRLLIRVDSVKFRALKKIMPTYPVNMGWKLSPSLMFKHTPVAGTFLIRFRSGEALRSMTKTRSGVVEKTVSSRVLMVETTLDDIRRRFLFNRDVDYISMEAMTPVPESRVLDLYLGPNSVNALHHHYPGLRGQGLTLSLKEKLFDVNDIDLAGRYAPSPTAGPGPDNHATEMATIAAGAGHSFVTGKGVASAATLTSSDYGYLFPDDSVFFDEQGVTVQNHSYGTVIENEYGMLAEAYDAAVISKPSVLHVFSAGNSGMETPSSGPYTGRPGVANLTGNFKMAKNIVTVGAVDTLGRPLPFSSKGPAFDGRIKPELVAYSTQGSSNTAALVSGTAVLLQERYRKRYGTPAPAALVKAVLINSASDAGVRGIDFATGYGNLDALGAMNDLDHGQFFQGEVSDGEQRVFRIEVPEGVRQLKATLVWNDPPAAPGASKALVNDLDLFADDGTTWWPWVLDHTPGNDIHVRGAQRGVDRVNNIEQVTITDPDAGTVDIVVSGFDVPQGPQSFFIAWNLEERDRFTWRFPLSSDNFPYNGETGTYFYWKSTFPDGTKGTLQYRVLPNGGWITLAEEVVLEAGAWRWTDVPDVWTTAEARMIIGDETFTTEVFTLSRIPAVSIGFTCGDSVMVRWRSQEGVDAYKLYAIHPESAGAWPLLITSDTSVILTKSEIPTTMLAVQAVVDGKDALRGPAFDYNALGGECFLVSFFNVVTPGEGVGLHIELGTTYHLSRIDVERQAPGGDFATIGSITDITSTSLFYHDDKPLQGKNRYRLRLKFLNGGSYTSWITEDFYLTTIPFVVFPNPVTQPREVAVYSRDFDTPPTFRLIRTDGSVVYTTPLQSDRETISLGQIAAGFYLYSITFDGGVFNGRLIVR